MMPAPERTPPPEPGMHYDVPFDVYSAWDAFRKSDIPELMRSPMHWLYAQDHPKNTPAMVFGSLVDTLLLEHKTLNERFALRPDTYEKEVTSGRGKDKVTTIVTMPWKFQSNTCRRIWSDLKASGKEIIDQATLDRGHAVKEALQAHPMVADWLARGRRQVSMVWVDEETGVLCKARLDLLVEPGEDQKLGVDDLLIPDLKVTANADHGPFRRVATYLGYHIQAGLYQEGYTRLHGGLCPPFYWIAAEDAAPYGVAVYPVAVPSLATGLKRVRAAMVQWKAMRESGEYWGYAVFQEELDVLPWAIDQEANLNG